MTSPLRRIWLAIWLRKVFPLEPVPPSLIALCERLDR
jgi:hypothetical protein